MSISRDPIGEFNTRIEALLNVIADNIDVVGSPPLSKKCEHAHIVMPQQTGQTILRAAWGILRKCQAFRQGMNNFLYPTWGKFGELCKYMGDMRTLLMNIQDDITKKRDVGARSGRPYVWVDERVYVVLKATKEFLEWLRDDSDDINYKFSADKLSPVIAEFRQVIHIGTIVKIIKPFIPGLPSDFSLTKYLDPNNDRVPSLNEDLGNIYVFCVNEVRRYEMLQKPARTFANIQLNLFKVSDGKPGQIADLPRLQQ